MVSYKNTIIVLPVPQKNMQIRGYTPDDYDDILEIARYIWDGNDYLPDMIDEYRTSPHCHPFVVEVDDHVVTVANSNFYRTDWIWLEAMRTHPDYRGRGLATQLTLYQQEHATSLGAREAWLFTSTSNKATSRMLEKLAYEEVGLYKMWGFNRIPEKPPAEYDGRIDGKLVDLSFLETHISPVIKDSDKKWRPGSLNEIKEILTRLSQSLHYPPLLVGEFNCFPIDSYFVEDMIARGQILIHKYPPAVMTFHPSKEFDGGHNAGILCTASEVVLSGLLFCYKQLTSDSANTHNDQLSINLFYPNILEISLLESEFVFRLMRKNLIV